MKERVGGRQRSVSFLSFFSFRERALIAAMYGHSLSLKHRTRAIRPTRPAVLQHESPQYPSPDGMNVLRRVTYSSLSPLAI